MITIFIRKIAQVLWINKYQFNNREIIRTKADREYTIGVYEIGYAVMAYAILSLSIFLTHYVYSIQKLNPWEDIYGRTFIGTILSCLVMRRQGTSPFELYSHIRGKALMMQATFILAFGLIMIGIQQVSLLTCTCTLLLFFVFTDYCFGIANIFIVAACVGLTILANPLGILKSGENQEIPILCLAIGAVL